MDVTLADSYSSSSERILYNIDDKNYQVLFEAAKRINEKEETAYEKI